MSTARGWPRLRGRRRPSAAGGPPGGWRTSLATVVLTALLLALLTPTARADQGPSTAEIAKALRDSPVYVDSAHAAEVPASARRALEEQIKDTGLRLYVVLVKFRPDDPWGGDVHTLATALKEELGSPEGVHQIAVTTSTEKDRTIGAFEWPDSNRYLAVYAGRAVSMEHRNNPVSLEKRVSRAIRLIETGEGMAAADRAVAEKIRGGAKDPKSDSDDSGFSFPLKWVALTLAVPLALYGPLFLYRRRDRIIAALARPRHVFSPALPLAPHVFTTEREEDENAIRRRARQELLDLGERLRAHEPTADEQADPASLRLALDAYAAAGKVLDQATGIPDLAGVLALVAEGQDALEAADRARERGPFGEQPPSTERPLAPCFVDPLHGRAARRVHWRPVGRRGELDVALCADCARVVASNRAPRMLTDQYDGRSVPYTEVPAEHSLWSATGYGSFGDEPLAIRVQRGDFTRAAAARTRAEKAD